MVGGSRSLLGAAVVRIAADRCRNCAACCNQQVCRRDSHGGTACTHLQLQHEAGEAEAAQARLPLLRGHQLPRAVAHLLQQRIVLLRGVACKAAGLGGEARGKLGRRRLPAAAAAVMARVAAWRRPYCRLQCDAERTWGLQ